MKSLVSTATYKLKEREMLKNIIMFAIILFAFQKLYAEEAEEISEKKKDYYRDLKSKCGQSIEKACEVLLKKCTTAEDSGVPCALLGQSYTKRKNYEEAERWLVHGCNLGDEFSCDGAKMFKRHRNERQRELAQIQSEQRQRQEQRFRAQQGLQSDEIDFSPLIELTKQWNAPPPPSPKRVRCSGSYNSHFQTMNTDCAEY